MKKKIALADCKYRSDGTQDCAGLPSKKYGRKTVQHPTQSPLTGFCKQMLQQLYVSQWCQESDRDKETEQKYQWQSDASKTEKVHFEKEVSPSN